MLPLTIALLLSLPETPTTPPGKVCPAVEGPAPKTEKDVKTQPHCEPQPTPSPTPKESGKQVKP